MGLFQFIGKTNSGSIEVLKKLIKALNAECWTNAIANWIDRMCSGSNIQLSDVNSFIAETIFQIQINFNR